MLHDIRSYVQQQLRISHVTATAPIDSSKKHEGPYPIRPTPAPSSPQTPCHPRISVARGTNGQLKPGEGPLSSSMHNTGGKLGREAPWKWPAQPWGTNAEKGAFGLAFSRAKPKVAPGSHSTLFSPPSIDGLPFIQLRHISPTPLGPLYCTMHLHKGSGRKEACQMGLAKLVPQLS